VRSGCQDLTRRPRCRRGEAGSTVNVEGQGSSALVEWIQFVLARARAGSRPAPCQIVPDRLYAQRASLRHTDSRPCRTAPDCFGPGVNGPKANPVPIERIAQVCSDLAPYRTLPDWVNALPDVRSSWAGAARIGSHRSGSHAARPSCHAYLVSLECACDVFETFAWRTAVSKGRLSRVAI